MGEENILKTFFGSLAEAVRLKIGINDPIKPIEIAEKIQDIDSSTSGSFHEEVVCYAPNGTQSIKNVVVAKDVTKIKTYAYRGLEKLETVLFLGDTEEIGQFAFDGCVSLSKINFPNSLKTISSFAFRGCRNLDIGLHTFENLTYVGMKAFESTKWYDEHDDGIVYVGKNVYIYKGNIPEGGAVVFSPETYSVSPNAFYSREDLYYVEGYSERIGASAFQGCVNLKEVIIHQIDGHRLFVNTQAFLGCSSLETVYFDDINLIDVSVFTDCPKLSKIYLMNKSVVAENVKGLTIFQNKPNVTIYVAKGMLTAWKTKLGDIVNGELGSMYNIVEYTNE